MLIQADADVLPVAVLTYDLDGTVTSANQAAAALLGSDSLNGTNAAQAGWLITDAAGWPDPDNIHPALAAAHTGQPQKGVVAHITTPQGAERWLQVDARPRKDAAGDVEQIVLTLTDITQLLSDARLPRPGYGAAAVATVTDHIAAAKLDPQAVLMPNVPLGDFMDALNDDTKAYLAAHPPPATAPTKHMGVLVVPMHARGSIVGALGLFERRSSNPLTQRDVVWIQEVADRMGLAADNAQLYVDAVSRLERLTALRSVQLAITAGPDLRLTLRVILDQAVQGLTIDAADVLLVDESDGLLSLVASTGFRSTSIPDYRLPVDEEMSGPALQARRITTVTTLGAFSQFRRRSLFAREGFKAYGAAPLIVGGKLMGVLEVFHRSVLEPDREWLEFLDALATDAALAIEHASLQQNARESRAPAVPRSASPAVSSLDKEILGYVAEGLSNRAIAEKVHLSSHTIKFHVGQMLNRSGTSNRTELSRKATQEGWI